MPNPSEPGLKGTVAWALMLPTGILVGLLHHSGLPWDPSNLAKALGESLRGSPLKAVSAYALPIPLGMALVHGLRRDFSPVPIKAKDFKLLPLGMLMAMGSVWAMGANDSYLFRYLPLGSMHAALGLTAMAVGILMPDWIGAISPTRNPRTQAGRFSPTHTQDHRSESVGQQTVQAYIEEVPHWQDGVELPGPPLSSMQWLVWSLATAGKFFEGLIVFMGGIALPLVSEQFEMSATDRGFVTAATLFGIMIGALALGGLADRFGRKPVFIAEMVLLLIGLVAAALSPNTPWLVGCLFLIGLALGADYPTAHLVISESIPASIRGRLVLGAFSFQAVGAVVGTALAAVLLATRPDLETWRIFYLMPVLPVALVVWGRLFLPESSHWLISRGEVEQAQTHLERLLNRQDVALAMAAAADGSIRDHSKPADWRELFQGRLLKATTLASVPWFLQDLSTYGIGIFTPVIIAAAFGMQSGDHNVVGIIRDDLLAARGTALIDVAFLVGISVAIVLADRWGRIPLQIVGFIGCALGLVLAAAGAGSAETTKNLPLIVAGFVLFQFMTNLGPNSQTYLLAGEVFPTRLRGLGAGVAAAAGKMGAVLTAFLFPVLLTRWGTQTLLPLLAITSLVGAAITWFYRIETKGLDLEGLH